MRSKIELTLDELKIVIDLLDTMRGYCYRLSDLEELESVIDKLGEKLNDHDI